QADRHGPSMTTRSPLARTAANSRRYSLTSPPGLDRIRTSPKAGTRVARRNAAAKIARRTDSLPFSFPQARTPPTPRPLGTARPPGSVPASAPRLSRHTGPEILGPPLRSRSGLLPPRERWRYGESRLTVGAADAGRVTVGFCAATTPRPTRGQAVCRITSG